MKVITILVFSFVISSVTAQDVKVLPGKVVNGDTMAVLVFDNIDITAELTPRQKKIIKQNEKLIRNLRIVMPYAQIAAERLKQIDLVTASIADPKLRKIYYKKQEEALIQEYEEDMRRLTFSQGKLLIKLIDRETGKTSYKIISEYRSNFTALFWQSFAKIFGYNLKSGYSPEEDADIEAAIRLLGFE